jgi:hypothetical protein
MALALLVLCIAAWVGSYWQGIVFRYGSKPCHTYSIVSCRLSYFQIENETSTCEIVRRGPCDWATWDAKNADFKFLGFTFKHDASLLGMSIPLWFPTALSAALVFFLWRKPRRKGGGFPVETSGQGEGEKR